MIRKYAMFLLLALGLVAGVAKAAEDTRKYDSGIIPAPHVLLPQGKVGGEVILISDAGGWGDKENAVANKLVSKGAVVIGIDFPSYLKALQNYDVSENEGCIYLVSDIESLSQQVQRATGDSAYELPIVAGVGEGGALALAIASQTPDATIAYTVAVDPLAGIPLMQDLCTPADKQKVGDRVVLGMSEGPLPNPIVAAFTPAAPKDGRAHVEALRKDHPEIEMRDSTDDPYTTLGNVLAERIKSLDTESSPLGLPINIMDAKPTQNTVAIIYSGDGGWRDIDKEVGGALQAQGIPVVGIDSLHYFWSERKPQETADDLGRIIEYYTKHFNVQHVLLIGYSFGADVLPASFNRLQPRHRDRVVQMSLLSLSRKVDYVISVMGWLGASSEGKGGDPLDFLKTINPKIVQCIYGKDDDEDVACPALAGTGVEVIGLDGGHHFDDDYETVANKIIAGLKSRLGE
jgi:type IV secretory pathway VirJ component